MLVAANLPSFRDFKLVKKHECKKDRKASISASRIVQHEQIHSDGKPNKGQELRRKIVCEEAEWGVVKPRMYFLLASSQSLAFSSLQITQNTRNLYLPWHLTQILIQQILFH